jgi:hypothetical protein
MYYCVYTRKIPKRKREGMNALYMLRAQEHATSVPQILLSADFDIINNSHYDTALRQNQGSRVLDVTGICMHQGKAPMLENRGCAHCDESCLLLGVAVFQSLQQRHLLHTDLMGSLSNYIFSP